MYPNTRRPKAKLKLLGSGRTQHINLRLARIVQDETGKLIGDSLADFEDISWTDLEACYALPPETAGEGVVLYLHGGGYATGSIQYAKGFGSVLARHTGLKTLCIAYRLAPEHPYPAALEDSIRAYLYLLAQGYAPPRILLCGESAGGGLCFSLCLRLKDLGLPLPGGIIAISPWVDLTLSGASYKENRDKDPILTKEALSFFVECYAAGQELTHPYISPLFGNLRGLPGCLLFAGGEELLFSEIYDLHKSLVLCGVSSQIHIARHMWHAYTLYGTREGEKNMEAVARFVRETLACSGPVYGPG